MAKIIERKIDMYKSICDVMNKIYPGKKPCCSSILNSSMEGIVYNCVYARNNEEKTICMLMVNELEKNKNYHMMLGFNNKEQLILKKDFCKLISEEEIRKNVKMELSPTINPVANEKATPSTSEFLGL